MNFSLTPPLESLVREVVRLFKRSEDEGSLKLQHLRAAITEGDKAVKQGDAYIFNSEQALDAFFAKL